MLLKVISECSVFEIKHGYNLETIVKERYRQEMQKSGKGFISPCGNAKYTLCNVQGVQDYFCFVTDIFDLLSFQ